jgi:hypothetical protein
MMVAEEPFADLFSVSLRKRAISRTLREPLLPLAGSAIVATLDERGAPMQSNAAAFHDGHVFYIRLRADAPELDNLRRSPRLSIHVRDPLDVRRHITAQGRAIELRVQPREKLAYVRIALDPDDERGTSDADG